MVCDVHDKKFLIIIRKCSWYCWWTARGPNPICGEVLKPNMIDSSQSTVPFASIVHSLRCRALVSCKWIMRQSFLFYSSNSKVHSTRNFFWSTLRFIVTNSTKPFFESHPTLTDNPTVRNLFSPQCEPRSAMVFRHCHHASYTFGLWSISNRGFEHRTHTHALDCCWVSCVCHSCNAKTKGWDHERVLSRNGFSVLSHQCCGLHEPNIHTVHSQPQFNKYLRIPLNGCKRHSKPLYRTPTWPTMQSLARARVAWDKNPGWVQQSHDQIALQ